MPYVPDSNILPDFETGGWAQACEVCSTVFSDWPFSHTAYLSIITECKPTRSGSWAIKITGELFEPPVFDREHFIRDAVRLEFGKIPVRFFQIRKRERRHLSAQRLSEIITGSEREAGPELWNVLQREGVRDAFLRGLPRLLKDSARHVIVRDVMES